MERIMAIHRLSQTKIKTLPEGLHCDGGGLYLRVKGGSKSWVFRFAHDKKTHDLGLGSLKYVSLSMARKEVEKIKAEFAKGRLGEILADRKTLNRDNLFPTMARAALDNQHKVREYSVKTDTLYRQLLRDHCQSLNHKEVGKITREDILGIVEPLWYTQNPTAVVLLRALKIVFVYCRGLGRITGDLPTTWEGGLSLFLKPIAKVHTTKHHEPVPLEQCPVIAARLAASPFVPARALVFAFATALRRDEFRFARWDGVDLENAIYTAPKTKAKDRPFRVPLSTQAVQFLHELPRVSDFIFPGATLKNGIGKTRIAEVAAEQGFTPHGIRSSFSMWCAENGIDPVLREMCLCHEVDNKVAASYQQSDLLERRREVMQRWCDFVFSSGK